MAVERAAAGLKAALWSKCRLCPEAMVVAARQLRKPGGGGGRNGGGAASADLQQSKASASQDSHPAASVLSPPPSQPSGQDALPQAGRQGLLLTRPEGRGLLHGALEQRPLDKVSRHAVLCTACGRRVTDPSYRD